MRLPKVLINMEWLVEKKGDKQRHQSLIMEKRKRQIVVEIMGETFRNATMTRRDLSYLLPTRLSTRNITILLFSPFATIGY